MNHRTFSFLIAVPAFVVGAACSSSSSSVTVATGTAPDGGEVDGGAMTDAPAGGTQCTTARDQLLLPIDKVSTGEVTVLGESNGTRTLFVDASAGGSGSAARSPRIYIDLAAGARVAVTDKAAPDSADWDLALKRTVIFTNGGDAGVGQGGAIQLNNPPGLVTADAARAAVGSIEKESFFDEECNAKLDAVGAPRTTFSDWYDYDQATNIPTPRDVTYVVRGGKGQTYKVGIKAYDALPDGGSRSNASTGFYLLEVTAL